MIRNVVRAGGVALLFGLFVATGGTAAAQAISQAPSVADLPRNQWLTAATAAPVGPDGVVRDEARRPYGYALLGQTFPAFSAKTYQGRAISEAALRGKWTIVDVWGIWCVDCRRDAPLVRRLSELAAADPDLEFVSIHVPASRSRAGQAFGPFPSVAAYFEKEGGGYPTIIDADGAIRDALQIAWTPTYLLVGPDLKIHAFRTDLSVSDAANVETALAQAKAIRKEVRTVQRAR